MFERLQTYFDQIGTKGDFCSLRVVQQRSEIIAVRQNVLQPVGTSEDMGAMLTVFAGGGMGYAATSNLTLSGLQDAADQALAWARQTASHSVVDFSRVIAEPPHGEYMSPQAIAWHAVSLADKIDLLQTACEQLKIDDRIVDWGASLSYTEMETLYLTSNGGRTRQLFRYIVPMLSATANEGAETQNRTFGGRGFCRQGGLEALDHLGFRDAASQIATEALQLLMAPNCPSETMDLLLAPDQMILQIHESIGHPLELDRILGDERNYAGTSFVTPDMFGSYRYGSDLLNITFDPSRPEQFASYAFDDEGLPAQREYLIKGGTLQRGLGSLTSQVRADLPGVANARACSWNRPPIDRMANLNLEPDDSRNKFQFGCEWGRLIEDGQLTTVVKKPNYRGISATFWRNLKMVGNPVTFAVMGTPNCGKGEPNQVIRVGHASPACLFGDVEVFGGA
jgi:predicted Zn-dependent protease